MKDHNYFVYITTNPKKTVLYVGVTNDLYTRMRQHFEDNENGKNTFAARYHCHNLIYYEHHQYVDHAIEREKELKGWTRKKKDDLINSFNPGWKFLNEEI